MRARVLAFLALFSAFTVSAEPVYNVIDLGTIPGSDRSEAYSINNNGQVVGSATLSPTENRAILFDSTGNENNINLGTLGGSGSSVAYSINNRGQIVGRAYDASGEVLAALFDPTGNGNNIDLNTLIDPASGWTLFLAFGINDSGWITGYGLNPEGDIGAFLLIPEPSTLLLFGLGAIILRRRI